MTSSILDKLEAFKRGVDGASAVLSDLANHLPDWTRPIVNFAQDQTFGTVSSLAGVGIDVAQAENAQAIASAVYSGSAEIVKIVIFKKARVVGEAIDFGLDFLGYKASVIDTVDTYIIDPIEERFKSNAVVTESNGQKIVEFEGVRFIADENTNEFIIDKLNDFQKQILKFSADRKETVHESVEANGNIYTIYSDGRLEASDGTKTISGLEGRLQRLGQASA